MVKPADCDPMSTRRVVRRAGHNWPQATQELDMNEEFSSSNSEHQLLSLNEVADRLNISPLFARTIMEGGLIPTVRTDMGLFVLKSDLDGGRIFRGGKDPTDKDGNPKIWTLFKASRKRSIHQ